jgi:hypothetical protein
VWFVSRALAEALTLRGADAAAGLPRVDRPGTPSGLAMTTSTSRTTYRALPAGPAWWPWRWRVYAFRPSRPHGAAPLPIGRRMRREEAAHEAAWQNACETKRLNKALLRGVRM